MLWTVLARNQEKFLKDRDITAKRHQSRIITNLATSLLVVLQDNQGQDKESIQHSIQRVYNIFCNNNLQCMSVKPIRRTPHITTIKVSRCDLNLHLVQDGEVQHTPSTRMFCPTTQDYKMNIHCKHNFPIFAEAFLPDGLPRKCTMRIIEPIMISQMVAKVYEVILEVNCSNKVKDHVGFKCTFLYVARWMKQRPLRNIFGLFCGFLQNIWYCTKKETTKKDTFASFKRPQCPMRQNK